jgi:type I restriction enzyme S subunit
MSLGPNAIMIKNNIASNYLYLYLISDVGQHSVKSIIAGSAQPKFNKTDFRKLEIVFPDEITLRLFNEIYKTINERVLSNKSQNQTLTALRDSLLPQLMTGKIEVK